MRRDREVALDEPLRVDLDLVLVDLVDLLLVDQELIAQELIDRVGLLGHGPVGPAGFGVVVDERRGVDLDARPQIGRGLVVVVLVAVIGVLVGSRFQRDRGAPDQRLALVHAVPALAG